MSLRTRLVLAFFTLSVVPLAAVTFYSYTTNVAALRQAAEREADLLAGELGQRMELVTAQLSERVEHLMDIAELEAAAEVAQAAAATPPVMVVSRSVPTQNITSTVTTPTTLSDSIAKSLGEAAMLLNNVELQNLRGGGGGRTGRGGPPLPGGGTRPPGTFDRGTGTPPSATTAAAGSAAGSASGRSGDPRRVGAPPPQGKTTASEQPAARVGPPVAAPTPTATPSGAPAQTPALAATPAPTPTIGPMPPRGRQDPSGQPPPISSHVDASGKLTIDMAPIRREMFRQIMPAGGSENLTPEERQRLAAEINQRMLGIAQGLQIGAAELQKRAQEAERDAATKAAAAPKASAATTAKAAPSSDLKRRSSLSGSHIDVKVERNGEVVRQMNAEINMPNVLATVFSTTRRDRGEVPFAVAKDGAIYARAEADKARVSGFGAVAKPGGPATARLNDWIVVTTEDKSGSGLRLGIARPVGDSLSTLRLTAARNAGLGLLFIAVALVGIVPLSSRLTRDLTTLSAAVTRIAHGDFGARVPVKANDEVGQLALAFNRMAADVERHQRTAVEQERIRRELELGRQIQSEMLPHAPLNLGLTQVQGVSVPAREVGGDFFNYFVLDNGHVALLMGDVSGKGVGAALLMANIQASLRIRLRLGQDLAAVTDAIDRDIEANSPGPVYATLFIAILDPASRSLRYVNAGHNPQYVLRLGGGLERMGATGLPVGLIAGRGYTEERVQLSAGDLLFLYTDGCVEVENSGGEMFGAESLEALLLSAVSASNALQVIERGIADFRGNTEPLDDATLMTVKVG